MKKRSLLTAILGGVLLLLSLSSCYNRVVPLPPWIFDSPDKEEPLTDEEALKGQWAVYEYMEGVETPTPNIIDIQHTLQDYWILIFTSEESTLGEPIKSDRKGPDIDGWFEVTDDPSDPDSASKIRYKFADNDRDTLEVEWLDDDPLILKRIPSEEEIKMHIVSFKLDDSFALDGYTIHSELAAVKDGTSFGDKGLPSLIGPDKTTVPALFTLADGTEITKDTIVNENITVIVAPDPDVGE